MYEVKNNTITEEVIIAWDQKFVPEVDYFYFEDLPYFVPVNERETVEFSLDIKTSYLPWNISAKARYIGIVTKDEFFKWKKEVQKEVLKGQIRLNRGYIFELDHLLNEIGDVSIEVKNALDTFSINIDGKKMITFQNFSWKALPFQVRTSILLYVANMFVDMHSFSVTTDLNDLKINYPTFASLLNTFGNMNGPNCLGVVLAALQTDEGKINTLLSKWVLPTEFYKELENKDYVKINTSTIQSNDVLIWEKDQNTLHSCFVLSNKLVFNKQGQTVFNPYQCVPLDDILSNWKWVQLSGGQLSIFRKK
ncbi:hypothetical protein [Gottfriedia luciferensis]|uniref:hypothetical protein n=1 Tax=Gottfriedia luciferensis TaxID=178774 RepID=UPI000B43092E|nr:hypothetical protein [Gottfriedia luciferensis]